MKRRAPYFWKSQTQWVRLPAVIEAHKGDTTVAVRIHPEHRPQDGSVEPASIFLTPNEAQAFAAWLSEQAEHLLAKQARAVARKAARAAAKEAKS